MSTKEKVLLLLNDLGNGIEECDLTKDINLQEFIIDSLQFISFIISLEEKFDIEFPDELLQTDNIKSLNAFCDIIDYCITDQKN